MTDLYKAIDVWRRQDGVATRYRCFQVLPNGGFCVQSSDQHRLSDVGSNPDWLQKNFLELLIEQAPEERGGVFQTLEEAISQHDRDFADLDHGGTP